jgi:hypothetical protein
MSQDEPVKPKRAHDRLKMLGCAIAAFWAATGVTADCMVPASLRACAALTNDGQRHACYDREMAKLASEPAVAAVPVPATAAAPSSTQSVPTPEQRFGLSSSRAQASESEPLQELEAKVASVREISDGRKDRALIELDNGQVWRQIDTDVTVRLRQGDPVVIKHNVFGSYWLSGNERSWRVRRVR